MPPLRLHRGPKLDLELGNLPALGPGGALCPLQPVPIGINPLGSGLAFGVVDLRLNVVLVTLELVELGAAVKEERRQVGESFERTFMTIAKELLSDTMYQEIIKLTSERAV